MDKALIAMSGGVDSSVAAWLMINSGFDCIGAMMKLFSNDDIPDTDKGCCSLSDADDARAVAVKLGIPFYLFNFSDYFKETVINRFISAYQNGATPNPCIDCNRYLKFGKFIERAAETGCAAVATGHYAKIEYDSGSGRFLLKKAADLDKDQTYVLYSMTQSQLAKAHFPLGKLSKPEVRGLAHDIGFANAAKRDSQDICFAPDGDYAAFIKRYAGINFKTGNFVDTKGNFLGKHRGIQCYTIGQRRGLGVSHSEPLYVHKIIPDSNTVVLTPDNMLYSKTLTLTDINLIAADSIPRTIKAAVKIRYRHTEQPAAVTQTENGELFVEFDEPQRAITCGQAAVIYDADTVIGGGTILP